MSDGRHPSNSTTQILSEPRPLDSYALTSDSDLVAALNVEQLTGEHKPDQAALLETYILLIETMFEVECSDG